MSAPSLFMPPLLSLFLFCLLHPFFPLPPFRSTPRLFKFARFLRILSNGERAVLKYWWRYQDRQTMKIYKQKKDTMKIWTQALEIWKTQKNRDNKLISTLYSCRQSCTCPCSFSNKFQPIKISNPIIEKVPLILSAVLHKTKKTTGISLVFWAQYHTALFKQEKNGAKVTLRTSRPAKRQSSIKMTHHLG